MVLQCQESGTGGHTYPQSRAETVLRARVLVHSSLSPFLLNQDPCLGIETLMVVSFFFINIIMTVSHR